MENLEEEINEPGYNKLANIAFALSVVGSLIFMFIFKMSAAGFILATIGFISGLIALREIKHTKEKGRGLAITSIIIGGIVFILIGISIFLLYS
jgi:hypothetical protein